VAYYRRVFQARAAGRRRKARLRIRHPPTLGSAAQTERSGPLVGEARSERRNPDVAWF